MKIVRNNPLAVIFFTVFVDLLGFGILTPVIPQLLANPRSKFFLLPDGFSLNQGFILLGFLTAIFPIMQFIATPILGELSDKFGRKPVLMISLAGTCISYIIFALGIINKNIPLLFLSRGFDGITGGNIAVAQASIADITTPENRAKNFGLIGAAFGLGFVVGPYLGGKLSDPSLVSWFDATTPFWFAAILALINVLSVFIIFSETNKHIEKEKSITWNKSLLNIVKAFNLENVKTIFASNFLYQAGFTFFTTFSSVFFISKFNWNQSNIGDFFAYIGIWIAFSQAVITPRVSKRFREDQIIKVTMIGSGIAIGLIYFSSQWWQLLLIIPIFSMFNGLSMASITALISRSVSGKIQGEVLGINASVQAVAQAIPPILSGYIASSLNAEAPVVVASIVIVLSGILFIGIYKRPIMSENTNTAPVFSH